MSTKEEPVPLPSASIVHVAPHVTLQPPLSRRGHGPGLIVLVPAELPTPSNSKSLDPLPQKKWAEEGYAVVQITESSERTFTDNLKLGIEALVALPECDQKDTFGLIVYSFFDEQVAKALDATSSISAVVIHGPTSHAVQKPQLVHLAGQGSLAKSQSGNTTIHRYPEAKSALFILPGHEDFLSSSAAVAHTRSLTFLKKHIGGPLFDLEAIWEEHTYFEFETREVEKTMGTMVQEPYVNHIPTMTGGIGRSRLSNFYRYHFIFNNPADTRLELVSRTVGIDRVIDEFVMHFTHNKVIDWLIPGIPPTGKKVEVAMSSVVNIRGDRLYHEHIAWDQASVLVQLGLLPEYLPFPYPLENGETAKEGKRFEYRVPAAGVETARKLLDENAVESNGLFEGKVREVDDK